jgi:hypothetical protein
LIHSNLNQSACELDYPNEPLACYSPMMETCKWPRPSRRCHLTAMRSHSGCTLRRIRCNILDAAAEAHGLVIQVRLGFPGAVTFGEDEVSWIPSVNQPLLLVRGKQDFVQLKQPSADSFSLWMRSKTMVTICFPILGFRFLSLGPDPRET